MERDLAQAQAQRKEIQERCAQKNICAMRVTHKANVPGTVPALLSNFRLSSLEASRKETALAAVDVQHLKARVQELDTSVTAKTMEMAALEVRCSALTCD